MGTRPSRFSCSVSCTLCRHEIRQRIGSLYHMMSMFSKPFGMNPEDLAA